MQCPKPDCMYLHELGDEAASFTKEEMQVMLLGIWTVLNCPDVLPKCLCAASDCILNKSEKHFVD